MNYIEAQLLIQKMEDTYDVSTITYKNVPIWPFMRLYLLDNLSTKRARGGSISNIWLILKRMFQYNPLSFFRKYDIWIYNAASTRKLIDGKYYSCISGAIPEVYRNTLTLENPESSVAAYKKNTINDTNIVSNAWSIMIVRGLEFLLRPFSLNIKNEALLVKILKECNSDFNYKKYVRFLVNQKRAADFFQFVSGKPKVVFIIDAYDQMGYVWSFHNHKVPVVELQHGVLNKSHNGYNCPIDTKIFAPDEICVFGEFEYKYLKNKVPQYAHTVTKTGMFFLDKVNSFYKNDIFYEYRNKYKKLVVVSGQTGYEDVLANFIEKVSKLDHNILYFYIPRRYTELKFTQNNVLLKNGVNIYPLLKWCDMHCTISSTTCLEAHYFKKKNVFYDYNNMASEYYKNVINENNNAFYTQNEEEFLKIVNCTENDDDVEYKELYSINHTDKIKKVLEKYVELK